jgi:formate hydrogenlyase subunit 6/NADH:ubiquinone oxidoreductase subunit I
MQPEMAFDKGYCTVDCTRCGQVCPAGAITEILPDMKTNIHIGEATWHGDRCIAATEGVNCTACFRHCPVKAIVRTKGSNGAMIPVVDADKCIGCGACEHVCPARPMPAMTVKAYEQHRDTQHH